MYIIHNSRKGGYRGQGKGGKGKGKRGKEVGFGLGVNAFKASLDKTLVINV